jgi:hypothetical protein
MSVSLADLVARLEEDVPARNSVPTDRQYQRCVKDAAADYSRRRSLRKLTTLSVVRGTAEYELPDDFLKVLLLESLSSPDGVLVSAAGLIPLDATYKERFYVVGTTLTLDPTPTYTLDRDLWYAAGYVLDADSVYQDMGEAEAGVVLLKAAALALTRQANKAAQEAWQYAVGDERVNKERLAEALRKQAEASEAQYLRETAAETGPVGMRARYDALGY